jgi:valyl-tRNA synthetase
LKTFYPTDVLVTGRDIIFLWVSRMVMTGMKFLGEKPFKDVIIHGTVLDKNGQRMSKTKMNGIDPLDVLRNTALTRRGLRWLVRQPALISPGATKKSNLSVISPTKSGTRRVFVC